MSSQESFRFLSLIHSLSLYGTLSWASVIHFLEVEQGELLVRVADLNFWCRIVSQGQMIDYLEIERMELISGLESSSRRSLESRKEQALQFSPRDGYADCEVTVDMLRERDEKIERQRVRTARLVTRMKELKEDSMSSLVRKDKMIEELSEKLQGQGMRMLELQERCELIEEFSRTGTMIQEKQSWILQEVKEGRMEGDAGEIARDDDPLFIGNTKGGHAAAAGKQNEGAKSAVQRKNCELQLGGKTQQSSGDVAAYCGQISKSPAAQDEAQHLTNRVAAMSEQIKEMEAEKGVLLGLVTERDAEIAELSGTLAQQREELSECAEALRETREHMECEMMQREDVRNQESGRSDGGPEHELLDSQNAHKQDNRKNQGMSEDHEVFETEVSGLHDGVRIRGADPSGKNLERQIGPVIDSQRARAAHITSGCRREEDQEGNQYARTVSEESDSDLKEARKRIVALQEKIVEMEARGSLSDAHRGSSGNKSERARIRTEERKGEVTRLCRGASKGGGSDEEMEGARTWIQELEEEVQEVRRRASIGGLSEIELDMLTAQIQELEEQLRTAKKEASEGGASREELQRMKACMEELELQVLEGRPSVDRDAGGRGALLEANRRIVDMEDLLLDHKERFVELETAKGHIAALEGVLQIYKERSGELEQSKGRVVELEAMLSHSASNSDPSALAEAQGRVVELESLLSSALSQDHAAALSAARGRIIQLDTLTSHVPCENDTDALAEAHGRVIELKVLLLRVPSDSDSEALASALGMIAELEALLSHHATSGSEMGALGAAQRRIAELEALLSHTRSESKQDASEAHPRIVKLEALVSRVPSESRDGALAEARGHIKQLQSEQQEGRAERELMQRRVDNAEAQVRESKIALERLLARVVDAEDRAREGWACAEVLKKEADAVRAPISGTSGLSGVEKDGIIADLKARVSRLYQEMQAGDEHTLLLGKKLELLKRNMRAYKGTVGQRVAQLREALHDKEEELCDLRKLGGRRTKDEREADAGPDGDVKGLSNSEWRERVEELEKRLAVRESEVRELLCRPQVAPREEEGARVDEVEKMLLASQQKLVTCHQRLAEVQRDGVAKSAKLKVLRRKVSYKLLAVIDRVLLHDVLSVWLLLLRDSGARGGVGAWVGKGRKREVF